MTVSCSLDFGNLKKNKNKKKATPPKNSDNTPAWQGWRWEEEGAGAGRADSEGSAVFGKVA